MTINEYQRLAQRTSPDDHSVNREAGAWRAIDADSVLRQMMRGYELMMEQMADRSAEVRGAMEDARLLFTYAVHDEPTLDVAPVRHSYWEEYSCSQYMGMDEEGEPKYRDGRFLVCHNYCCRRKTVVKSNYCPNCGAKMDAGQEDDSHGDNSDG